MKSEWIRLKAKDGHELDAFSVKADDPIGNIVVIQEIFGITDHIQAVCHKFASNGYDVIAPAIYDRFERNITLDYTQIEEGVGYKMKLSAKGRYAIKALVNIATNDSKSPKTLLEISKYQGISLSYLEQLFSLLRKNDLVSGVRGPGGGYRLKDNPDNITIAKIIVNHNHNLN